MEPGWKYLKRSYIKKYNFLYNGNKKISKEQNQSYINTLSKYIEKELDNVIMYERKQLHKGIYFLFKNGEICYIGISKNLYFRINTHTFGIGTYSNKKNSLSYKPWDHFAIIQMDVPMEILQDVEKELILKYKPKYNSYRKNKEQINDN